MKIVIVKVLSVINLVFLMAVVSALDTETIGADVFTVCMLSMALGIVLMHILEHLKRRERRRRENERQASLYLRISAGRRKRA